MDNVPISASVRELSRLALREGGKIALDVAIRIVGKLVEDFTVKGMSREAVGASAAMELLKRVRQGADELYSTDGLPKV